MAHYPGYTVLRTEDCPEQHGTLTLLTHDVSGAAVLLVENEDVNKAFGIGFGTFPSDDTGVFHILEHSVLAGSEKYPVSSPFVQLLKSSMASFLNAMTFPDKTVYPFATPNETDFCNLMDVYLNAVFCPLAMVDSAVFEQEGWHRDANGTVSGVVYNEMQGALASPDAQLQNALQRAMFPDTAYGFVSGGDPASIPALTYEKYQRVYRRHYSADNCCITLYGKMDMADKLARLDKDYLSKMPKAAARPRLTMQDEQPGAFVELPYYTDQPKPDEVQCALAWYTGAFADRERQLGVEILLGALLSTNSSPLKAALLAEQLGADIDIGFDDSTLQPTLELLLRGATVDSARKFAPAVRKAVDELLKAGIPHDLLLAALNEAEFASLERPGSLPDGVLDAINAATGWLHTGDAALLLHTDKLFAALRSKLEEGWFDTLLRELFASAPVQVLQIPTAPKAEVAALLAGRVYVRKMLRDLRVRVKAVDDIKILCKLCGLLRQVVRAAAAQNHDVNLIRHVFCLLHRINRHAGLRLHTVRAAACENAHKLHIFRVGKRTFHAAAKISVSGNADSNHFYRSFMYLSKS